MCFDEINQEFQICDVIKLIPQFSSNFVDVSLAILKIVLKWNQNLVLPQWDIPRNFQGHGSLVKMIISKKFERFAQAQLRVTAAQVLDMVLNLKPV